MMKTWKNGKNHNFGPTFGTPKILFLWFLPLLVSQCSKLSSIQVKGELMIQTCENGKKPNFMPNFGPSGPNLGSQKNFSWVLPLLIVRHCSKLSYYEISWKANKPNFLKMVKNLILGPILARLTQIWPFNFFLQILLLLVGRQYSKLSLYTI